MAFPTMFTLFMLAPKARKKMDQYFASEARQK